MTPFTTLTAIAAPLPIADCDTDQIIPARFLKTIRRDGLRAGLFADLRGGAEGTFVLDRPPFDRAAVLIAGENFGCGSSREHAAWALADFGIRVVIAPSFGDIFATNAAKNGLLTVVLPAEACAALMADAALGANARLTVDLERQTVTRPDGEAFGFTIDAGVKRRLLEGRDDIDDTLAHADAIAAFEAACAAERPWLAA